jgi:hypothetical protein
VGYETDTDKTEPNEPESTSFGTASFSLVLMAVVAAINERSPAFLTKSGEQDTCFAEIIQRASTKRGG